MLITLLFIFFILFLMAYGLYALVRDIKNSIKPKMILIRNYFRKFKKLKSTKNFKEIFIT